MSVGWARGDGGCGLGAGPQFSPGWETVIGSKAQGGEAKLRFGQASACVLSSPSRV